MRKTYQYKCDYCDQSFLRTSQDNSRCLQGQHKFCSIKCTNIFRTTKISVLCKMCGKNSTQRYVDYSRNKVHFCSKSCAATYNNTHKTKGYRRSKLEIYLEEQLQILYPNLQFLFNDKSIINSELDIYIPNLKLAFELNGIFHYEPIYGQEKLSQIQNNDNRKYQACLELGISLCILDTSQQKYFKTQTSQKYLDIICNIINQSGRQGDEPL